ncbi:MAG: hypothetical protein V4687_16205 [Bacteroidota bacterium]
MSKFKKGDPVVNKWNSDLIYKVENPEWHVHNAFPVYMKLEGESKPVREEDYVLVNSIEELVRYAAVGVGVMIAVLGGICAVMLFCRFTLNIQF